MPDSGRVPVKIVVAGGFGVGKTTLVSTLSEIPPLTTEAAMTVVSEGIDDLSLVRTKRTTTVAFDFGRVTIDASVVLYLFGTPGQDRFGFMWDDLVIGSLGAVVLADTRRLDLSFPAIDYFESRNIPFVVALNRFDGEIIHSADAVKSALALGDSVPVIDCDARRRESAKQVVLTLLRALLQQARQDG